MEGAKHSYKYFPDRFKGELKSRARSLLNTIEATDGTCNGISIEAAEIITYEGGVICSMVIEMLNEMEQE